jgi:Protein kinase domain
VPDLKVKIPQLLEKQGGAADAFDEKTVQEANRRLNRLSLDASAAGVDNRTLRRIPFRLSKKPSLGSPAPAQPSLGSASQRPRRALQSIIGQFDRGGAPTPPTEQNSSDSDAGTPSPTVSPKTEVQASPRSGEEEEDLRLRVAEVDLASLLESGGDSSDSTTDDGPGFAGTPNVVDEMVMDADDWDDDDDDDWETDPDFSNAVRFSRDVLRASGVWERTSQSDDGSVSDVASPDDNVTVEDEEEETSPVALPPLTSYFEIPQSELEIDRDNILGEGSFATIYAGLLWGTPVAVKVLKQVEDLSVDLLLEFRSEVNVMMQLRHPCVLHFLGAVCEPGVTLALVTELCEGGTLEGIQKSLRDKFGASPAMQSDGSSSAQSDGSSPAKRTCRGKDLPSEEWARLMHLLRDFGLGLRYLHQIGIAHLDVKPENLLVTKHGEGRVADLGLSQLKATMLAQEFPEHYGTPGSGLIFFFCDMCGHHVWSCATYF